MEVIKFITGKAYVSLENHVVICTGPGKSEDTFSGVEVVRDSWHGTIHFVTTNTQYRTDFAKRCFVRTNKNWLLNEGFVCRSGEDYEPFGYSDKAIITAEKCANKRNEIEMGKTWNH